MNFNKPINILYKQKINLLGEHLINARRSLVKANRNLKLSDSQYLRLLLLCCLYVEEQHASHNDCHEDEPPLDSVMGLCDFFAKSTTGSKNWVQEYLQITDVNTSSISINAASDIIKKYINDPDFYHLLPYALELLEYSDDAIDTAIKDRRNGLVTSKKKNTGIYYTPNDVVSYMVNTCLDLLSADSKSRGTMSEHSFVDFSCGSGVFLLQVLRNTATNQNKTLTFQEYVHRIEVSIYGIDISPCSVDNTRFILLSEVVHNRNGEKCDYGQLLHILEENIICGDSTNPATIYLAHPHYPHNFNCIIGNPPYVTAVGSSCPPKSAFYPRNNLFIPFVYNLITFAADTSVCALVVPLSVAYNSHSDFKALRTTMENDLARWYFEHYDRSPDSLFGDDVKSRNSIIFRTTTSEKNGVFSTQLLRWTSKNRHKFLSSPKQSTNITGFQTENFIPKLGTDIEFQAFKILLSREPLLGNTIYPLKQVCDYEIVLRGTAYNWICAYDHMPESTDQFGNHYQSKEMKRFGTTTKEDQYFSLACLNSISAFWLWTVIGDGFHVTNQLLSSLGVSANQFDGKQYSCMVELGKNLCENMKLYPVKSNNAGKTITNYNHMPLMNIIKQIDNLITCVLSLPQEFPDFLQKWYFDMVNCGRPSKNA